MNWKLIFFCFCSLFTSAQGELAFRNFTLESGLPSNTVYESFQDEKGYIYVGHNNGVSVFNGLSFQSPKCDDKNSALSNFISFSNGQIMCRNFQGKHYILKNGKLTSFESSLHESWGFPTYLQDGDDHYVFQSSSFYTLNEEGKGKRIELPLKNISRIYHGIVYRKKAYLFVSTSSVSQLICFDLRSEKIVSSRTFNHDQNVYLFKGNNGIVWIDIRSGHCGTYDNGFINTAQLYVSALPKESKITGFKELKDGTKLISSFNGVYRLNQYWQFERHYLEGIQCTNLMLDKNNGLWISSLQNGLFYAPNIEVIQINSTSISGRNVKYSKVHTYNNEMYVGTHDGRVLKFNSKGELLKTYDFKRNVEIQSMHTANNELYAYCGGLLTVDLSSGAIQNEITASACKSIYRSGDRLICGTSKGIILFENGNLTCYLDTLWVKNALPINESVLLLECAENVQTFNLKTKKLTLIQAEGTNVFKLGEKWYFRTETKVFELNKNLKKKKIYHSRFNIVQLYPSDNKLTLDLDDNRVIQLYGENFKKEKALAINVLNDVSFVGEIGAHRIRGNNNSIQLIPKNQIVQVQIPKILLVSKKGKYKLENNRYVLPFNENDLTFEFDLLPNYHYSGEGEVYYRIAELNLEWKKVQKGDRYVLELLRIPSGNFTLEVYGESGGVNSEIKRYSLTVKQPFYYQWWFIGLMFLFVIGVTYLVMRWRGRLKEIKNQRFLKEQQLKMKALNSELVAIRSQMNPHFIFNSLSSIQTKILNEDRVEAYNNVNTFAKLLRQALQFTSKEFITLQEELEFTRNYILLEQTRTSDSFEYIEEIDPSLQLITLSIPSLFLQPFIENAIRHGLMHSKNGKRLILKIRKVENGFEAVIEDNGIGRLASSEINRVNRPNHTSFATQAIDDRIDILRETNKMKIDLRIEDLESGTRVAINFRMV